MKTKLTNYNINTKNKMKSIILLSKIVFMQTGKNNTSLDNPTQEIIWDQRWPGIEKYPRAIREWDSLRVEIVKFRKDITAKGGDTTARLVDLPYDLLLSAARAQISARLFYWNLKYDAPFLKYPPGGDGFLVRQIKRRLLELWELLAEIDGVVLVEAFKDTMLPRSQTKIIDEEYPRNLVLYGKVLDDIFGTIEEDTIMTRHNTVWFKDNFSISAKPELLLILRSGTTYIYFVFVKLSYKLHKILYEGTRAKYQDITDCTQGGCGCMFSCSL